MDIEILKDYVREHKVGNGYPRFGQQVHVWEQNDLLTLCGKRLSHSYWGPWIWGEDDRICATCLQILEQAITLGLPYPTRPQKIRRRPSRRLKGGV